MGGACSTYEELRNTYRILIGKPEVKRPFERSRRRWKDNIRLHLNETGREVWAGLSWLKIGASGGLS
jgi:hypothetical protein